MYGLKYTLKRIILWGGTVFSIYFMLANHILIYGRTVTTLPKSELTLVETFVNITPSDFRPALTILREHPNIYYAGAGEIMRDLGLITEQELISIQNTFNAG